MSRPDYAREIKAALTDPKTVCERLGIDLRGAKRQSGGGLVVRCPAHEERTPSCSITVGREHTLRVKCFGCDWSGDLLSLVALVRRIPKHSFREILAEAADVAGLDSIVDEIRKGKPAPDRPPMKPLPPPEPPRPYLAQSDVRDLWQRSAEVTTDTATTSYLVKRRLDPELIRARGLARVLRSPLPSWGSYGGRSWLETGHRMIFRVFDAWGRALGVRVCRVVDGDTPKRLPAAGYRAGELVLANRAAWAMLRGDAPGKILIAEGETDWLTLATVHPEEVPIMGIGSGSWTDNFAAAIPRNADVYVYTDPDEAGDRYAAKVFESLGEKCRTWRCAPRAA